MDVIEAEGRGAGGGEDEAEKGRQVLRTLHKTIRKVTGDMDDLPLQHRRLGDDGAAERGARRVGARLAPL